MRAIVLAGGKGTRLRPYTTLIPKPLVPLGGRYSILEIIILQLKRNGFTHVTLAVNHLSQLIMAYFGDGSRMGITLDYSLEEDELSTIGPLTLIKDLPDDFLVMNGDVLCNLNFGEFLRTHLAARSSISVSSFRRQVQIDFGVLRKDERGHLTGFEEKPRIDYEVSMGVYALNRSVIESLPRGERYGFDNLMIDGLANGHRIDIRPFDGYWLDIGRPEDYERANENFDELSSLLGLE
jgi:NDP-mannose synthase